MSDKRSQVYRFGDVTLEITMLKDFKIESAVLTQGNSAAMEMDEDALRNFHGFLSDIIYYADKSRAYGKQYNPFDRVFNSPT